MEELFANLGKLDISFTSDTVLQVTKYWFLKSIIGYSIMSLLIIIICITFCKMIRFMGEN